MARRNRTLAVALMLLAAASVVLVACSSTSNEQAVPPASAATSAAGPTAAAEAPASAPASRATAGSAQASGDKALVTVYRKKRVVGAILNTSVHVDGVEVADLDPGTYVRVAVAPGRHEFYADETKDTITLEVEAGKQYYFRMGLVAGLWKGNGKLEAVSEQDGAAEYTSWKLKLAKDIRERGMVVPDPEKP